MRRNELFIVSLASALVLLPHAGRASAALIHLTQDRALTANTSAEVSGTPVTDNKGETSAELGPFDRSLTSHAEAVATPPAMGRAVSDAAASHAVQFAATSITGALAADGHIQQAAGRPSAQVNSSWNTTFRVDRPMPFDLTGRLRMSAGPTTGSPVGYTLAFTFWRSDGTLNEPIYFYGSSGQAGLSGFGADEAVNVSGTLEPGYVYSMSATVAGNMQAEGTVGADKRVAGDISFSLTAVPEPSAAAGFAAFSGALLRRRCRPR